MLQWHALTREEQAKYYEAVSDNFNIILNISIIIFVNILLSNLLMKSRQFSDYLLKVSESFCCVPGS